MKKTGVKKLVLAKETIRGLDSYDLGRVAGGGVTDTCYSGNLGCELIKIIQALTSDC